MVNVQWPGNLRPANFGFYHIDTDQSGGQGVGGGEQFVASPGARWGASMTLPIRNKEAVLSVRALRSQLQGRANPAVLPNFDGQRLSWPPQPLTDWIVTPKVAQYLEGTLALDRTPHTRATIPAAAEINATIASDAAIRATTVAIDVSQGGPLRAGQQFGLASRRLYEIATIVSVAGTVTTVTIWPPTREAYAAGAVVQFTRAACLMRCTNMSGELRALELLRYATLNLEFEEYL